MFRRIVIAGALGGLVLFFWESVAHMALPLGEAGFRTLPNEPAMMARMKEQVKEEGLYLFPAPELRPGMSLSEKNKAIEASMAKAKLGPSGMVLIHPAGDPGITHGKLGTQLLADILAMMAAAWVLCRSAATRYWGRVAFVGALSVFPILTVHVPNWNWYGFPASFTLAAAATHVVGFCLAGLVLAKVTAAGTAKAAAAAAS